MPSRTHAASPPVDVDHFRPIRLSDLYRAFSAYRKSAIVVSLCLLPLLVGAVWLIPAQFDSYAQLLVRLGRGAVALDPTTSLSPTVSLQDSRASQVNSVKEMLQSRALADKVVTKVGVDRVLEPRSPLSRATAFLARLIPSKPARAVGDLSADQVTDQINKEMAILAFHRMLNLSVAGDAYTISLEVRTEDPFLSRDLLKTLLQEYQVHHASAHNSSGSYEFFREQAETAFERAMKAKEALREAKTKRGVIDVGSSQNALRSLLSEVESSLLQTENALVSAQAEIESLVGDISQSPATVETEVIRGIPKATGNSMRQSLYDLEVSYNELAVKYKPDHPKLRALREQLDAAAQIAKLERGEQPQTREAINPIRQQLELSHRQALSSLAGLESKRERLVEQKEKLLSDLDQLNQAEVELTRLSWESDLAEQEYLRAAAARDNAQTIDKLASGSVSEISIVQDASLGLKKVKPRRSLLAILAVFLAFGMGLSQAVIRGLLFVGDQDNSPISPVYANAPRLDPPHSNGNRTVPETTQSVEGAPAQQRLVNTPGSPKPASTPAVPR